MPPFSVVIPVAILAPLEIAAAGDLVAHGGVDGRALLADAEPWAKESHAEVIKWVVFNLHDLLQPHAEPDHETAGAQADRPEGAAAPAEGRLPEAQDACHGVGVGHADQRTAEAMDADPLVAEAFADCVVKVIGLWAGHVAHLHVQGATPLEDGFYSIAVVEASETKHEQQL